MKPPEAMPAVIELERTAVAGAQIIDGIAVSKIVRVECRARVKRLNASAERAISDVSLGAANSHA